MGYVPLTINFAISNLVHTSGVYTVQQYNLALVTCRPYSTGKTYTMFGHGHDVQEGQRGLVYRTLEHLFHVIKDKTKAASFTVLVSFIEIYMDHVRDLTRVQETAISAGAGTNRKGSIGGMDGGMTMSLDLMEDAAGDTFVKDINYVEVGPLTGKEGV